MLAVLGLVPALALAQAPAATSVTPQNAVGPRLEFTEPVFDFGSVDAGTEVRHAFTFKNTGDQVLEILSVRPGCGCTTAGEWDRRVEPGATGSIPLALRSTGFSGPISKSATITCNDPTKSTVLLQLRGTVRVPIQVEPRTLVFQYDPEATEGETKSVKIINNLTEPITLGAPQWNQAAFKADLKTLKPGREFELQVTTVPPVGSGTVTAPITLSTSATNTPNLQILAYALERRPLLVSPTQIFLPPGPLTSTQRVVVTLRANNPDALTLSDPSLDLPGVDLDLKEVQRGLFRLTATFPPGFELPPEPRPKLTIKTSLSRLPKVEVPLMARPAITRALPPAESRPAPDRTTNAVVRPIPLPPLSGSR